jgi:hypothetical protein
MLSGYLTLREKLPTMLTEGCFWIGPIFGMIFTLNCHDLMKGGRKTPIFQAHGTQVTRMVFLLVRLFFVSAVDLAGTNAGNWQDGMIPLAFGLHTAQVLLHTHLMQIDNVNCRIFSYVGLRTGLGADTTDDGGWG